MDDFATTQPEVDLFDDDYSPEESTPSLPVPTNISPPNSAWNRENQSEEHGQEGRNYRPTDQELSTDKRTGGYAAPTQYDPEARPRNKTTELREPTVVRGDRSGTGGIKKPKLTEEELAQKMAEMKLKSEQREKQHSRQEADKAAQSKLEKLNQQKLMEEQRAAREQDMERAKNRQRKLRAQGGREWDSEKQESDIVDRSRGQSSQYSRGANGGMVQSRSEG